VILFDVCPWAVGEMRSPVAVGKIKVVVTDLLVVGLYAVLLLSLL
jgi:hypothetical protein